MTGRLCKNCGFTLIEMLVVILVIGILVALVVSVSGTIIRRGYIARTRTDLEMIMKAVQIFHEDTIPHAYPAGPNISDLYRQLQDVPRAVDRLRKLDPKVSPGTRQVFLDGFGFKLRYLHEGGPAGSPLLISPGPDGDFGTEDDIRSDGREP